ncbi:MAG: lysoplasmalogenase family protein [Candidatus Thorarchaeota archaeon]
MSFASLKTPLSILRVVIVLVIFVSTALLIIMINDGTPNWNLLFTSAMIVILALVNFMDKKSTEKWSRFTLLMFVAMLICFAGDLAMGYVFHITPDPLINGVLMFSLGHVVYLFALKDRSSLLLRSESPRLIKRNVIIWIVNIVIAIILFVLTLYNPAEIVISMGLLGYGILLTTVLAFSLSKWFDDYPKLFVICLSLGFLLFFISDYIIGYRTLTDPSFLSDTEAVGVTYIGGQLLIHISSVFGGES